MVRTVQGRRDLSIGTLNGRLVMVDDSMPTTNVYSAGGVYTVAIAGTPAAGEKYTIDGASVTVTDEDTATKLATSLATALGSNAHYTVTRNTSTLTLTEKSGQYGYGAPATSATGVGTNAPGCTQTVATTTAPVGVTQYTTYVFGDGAIEYTNCGAKVPYEMDRDPKTNGGQDTLYSRQRKCFAPYGISFTKASMSSLSPTDAELEMGVNWELVNSNEQGTKTYISSKAITIARIISLG